MATRLIVPEEAIARCRLQRGNCRKWPFPGGGRLRAFVSPPHTVAKEPVFVTEEECWSRRTRQSSKSFVARTGDRRFESPSLRRPVCPHQCLPCLPAAKTRLLPGVWSLDETRERDVLAPSRLALAAFSLTGIAAVPPREIKAQQREEPRPCLGTLCCGSLFSSPGGCADRSNRAADRVR